MTYCIGITLNDGLVLTSDSRTNAGIDQVSTYSKMHTCSTMSDRFLVIMSAGNLATTQGVIEQIRRDIREQQPRNVNMMAYMADIAEYLGDILVNKIQKHSTASGFIPEASLILAGQIQGESPQIYMIYPQGNYITTSEETPYLQIGESKYGKPILDRFINEENSLQQASICSLISMDSTMHSNASVGPPIEIIVYQKDSFVMGQHYKFDADHPYLTGIRNEWANQLNLAFQAMPNLPDY